MSRYHPALVALHWLLALMILGALVAGTVILEGTPNDDPFKLTSLAMHMSLGIAILVLMLVRLGVRLSTAKPPEADTGSALLNVGARATHWLFYLLVLGITASGIVMANLAGLPAIVFGGSGDPLPADFDDLAPRAVHGVLTTLLGLLILAHVAAALWHQFVRRDGLFARMWFGDRTGG